MANDLQRVSMKNYLTAPSIDKYISDMLGERKTSFITTLTSMAGAGSKLGNCDKQSIMLAALKAVGMNLPIDQNLGFAWIIPYGDKAQFQLGVKGYLQLAFRTKNYITINSIEVRQGEFKGRNWIGDPILEFLPETERLKREIEGYAAGYETVDGMRKIVYWTKQSVEEHASRFSQAYRSFKAKGKSASTARSGNMSNPWATDFDSMAKKTVLKNLLSQYGELTTELQQALKYDQSYITLDEQGEEDVKYIDNMEEDVTEMITKEQQAFLLNTYPKEYIQEALFLIDLQDITQITDYEEFVKSCVEIEEENKSYQSEIVEKETKPVAKDTKKTESKK